jgi:hypothetical protein
MPTDFISGYLHKQAYIPIAPIILASTAAAEGKGILDGGRLSAEQYDDVTQSMNPWRRAYLAGRLTRESSDTSAKRNGSRDRSPVNVATEFAGPVTSSIVPGALGAAGGVALANATGVDPWIGGLGGGLAGVLAPLLAAKIIMRNKKVRTEAEQAEYDRHNAILDNLMIPGVAAYQGMQRDRTARIRHER